MAKVCLGTRTAADATYLLRDLAVGYWLSAELDTERVSTRYSRRVHDTDGTVAIVDNVDVDVTGGVAVDATRHVAVARLRRVDVDDALLAHRDRRADAICRQRQQDKEITAHCDVTRRHRDTPLVFCTNSVILKIM